MAAVWGVAWAVVWVAGAEWAEVWVAGVEWAEVWDVAAAWAWAWERAWVRMVRRRVSCRTLNHLRAPAKKRNWPCSGNKQRPCSSSRNRSRSEYGNWKMKTKCKSTFGTIGKELKAHAPFTMFGTLTGIAIMVVLLVAQVPRSFSASLFWSLHPLHVLLSALVTAGMFRLHGRAGLWGTIAIGYVGSIGIATLSDCIIPYVGESLLGLPNKRLHLGFIEKWWLVNPMAGMGIAVAFLWPRTKFPHAGHVLLSTWASLFHMTMALGGVLSPLTLAAIPVFLFLAVWLPCCTSDIVFPLLFSKEPVSPGANSHKRIPE